MKLGYVILYVPEIKPAVSFYETAFGLKRRFVHESGDYAEMETGQTVLAFASDALGSSHFEASYRRADPGAAPPAFEITLVTGDVARAFGRATDAGAFPLAEPSEKPWGQIVSYVRDLNGVIVEICTPVGGVVPRFIHGPASEARSQSHTRSCPIGGTVPAGTMALLSAPPHSVQASGLLFGRFGVHVPAWDVGGRG